MVGLVVLLVVGLNIGIAKTACPAAGAASLPCRRAHARWLRWDGSGGPCRCRGAAQQAGAVGPCCCAWRAPVGGAVALSMPAVSDERKLVMGNMIVAGDSTGDIVAATGPGGLFPLAQQDV